MKLGSVVLVDDENTIRNGLRRFIDWDAFGLQVVADFEDGEPAMRYLSEHQVDLVITDIKMVHCSGIDVARYIYENKLETTVVLLSGYREFDYAQQAIRYGVRHYLLKPFDEDEIEQVLQDVCEEINKAHEQKQQKEQLGKYIKQVLPQLRQEFFSDLYLGMIRSHSMLEKRLEVIGLENAKNHGCCIVQVVIKNYSQALEKYEFGKERLKQEIVTYIRDGLKGEYYIVYSRGETIKILAFDQNEDIGKTEKWKIDMQRTVEEIYEIVGVKLQYSIEHSFDSLSELMQYRAQNRSERSATEASGQWGVSKEEYAMLQEQFHALIVCVFSRGADEMEDGLQVIEQEVEDLPLVQYRTLYEELLVMATRRYIQAGGADEQAEQQVCEKIRELAVKKDVYQFVKKTLTEYRQFAQKDVNTSMREIVDRVRAYIANNYNRQMSLEEISGQVYLSASYVSRIFKQLQGITVMDYVIECRIKKAIELMKSGKYRMYEISEMVGYSSVQYFNRQFKGYTGFTPKQYIRKE